MVDSDTVAKGCAAFSLRRASRIVTRRYEQALRPVNLSSFQFTTLFALNQAGSLPQAWLADELGMDLSTLTRNLRPLIKRELIEVYIKARDKRIKYATITPKGRDTFEAALPLWKAAQDATLKDLSPAEWDALKKAIRKLA